MKKLRCVGYVKPMDKMEKLCENRRIPAIDVEMQKTHILEYAGNNGWNVSKIYEEADSMDFSCEEEFNILRNDAIHRKFDVLILDSIYCLGESTYIAIDIFMRAYYPAGIHLVVVSDGIYSKNMTYPEIQEYLSKARNWYRSRQALITRLTPDRQPIVTTKYERREKKPDCILGYIPEDKRIPPIAKIKHKPKSCYQNTVILKQLFSLIKSEQKRAAYAKSKLQDAILIKEKRLLKYYQKEDELWHKMCKFNQLFMKNYYDLLNGVITQEEYDVNYTEYMKECEAIEKIYSQCRRDIYEIECLFDTENLWIKRFTESKLPQTLTNQNVGRWIEYCEITGENVENVRFTYWEWREALPDICKNETEE